MTGSAPVCDQEAEEAVISSCLLSLDAFHDASDAVRPEHFFIHKNRVIFEGIRDLDARGIVPDTVTLAGHLRSTEKLDSVGGTPELARLTDCTPSVARVRTYAERVAALALQRRVIDAAREILLLGNAPLNDVGGFCASVEAMLSKALQDQLGKGGPVEIGKVAGEVVERTMALAKSGVALSGKRSGFSEVDYRLSGWTTGLHVIAGRPGMGKTALVLWILLGIVRLQDDEMGVFFSLEMPKEQLATRALSGTAKVPLADLRANRTRGYESDLTAAAELLRQRAFRIDDEPAVTVSDVRRRSLMALREKRRETGKDYKLGVVAIDYIQLMTGKQGEGREREVSSITRDLKNLSKELGCPIIALSQLNRGVEKEKDKRPRLSDLRESGAIEQDADTIIFVYRDEYYFDDSPDKGLAEFIVAKQRNGPTGTIKLKFRERFTLFEDLVRPSDEYIDDLSTPPDYTMPEFSTPYNERGERR